MEINGEITTILRANNISKDAGLLVLLGIYYHLDVEAVCPETIIKQINLTKIVEKDYTKSPHLVIWNVPLFIGQQTEWDWVKTEYNQLWNRNMSRKASNPDVLKRMQEFFSKYPEYRKDDVMKAVRQYHADTKNPEYLKNSAAFIFDGAGAMKKSILLGWCEKTKNSGGSSTFKGTLIT